MRIVSLIPAATEIIAGLIKDPADLVGITHECDYPRWVRDREVVVGPFDELLPTLSPDEIDRRVAEAASSGQSIYIIHEEKLASLRPDVIITQGLCDVCAVGPGEVAHAMGRLDPVPAIVSLSPSCVVDVLDDIVRIGDAIDRSQTARQWRERLVTRLEWIGSLPRIEPAPKVLVLEWPAPLWSAGHWVPEMIDLAGGHPTAGEPGKPSTRLDVDIIQTDPPDFLLIASCGFDTEKNAQQIDQLKTLPGWNDCPAVRQRHVYAVDANSYFSRPSPRLVDGTEILLALLRGMPTPEGTVRRLLP
ncbi:ABC transporter substrate-binding protein [bacterium]|nr:ABC transporter substrate-binding protein [bacterium]